jgi:putative Holliday junction resolvase
MGLDVGTVRVGVAVATGGVSVARPVATLDRSGDGFWDELAELIRSYDIQAIVVGLPRGLDGQETDQTRATKTFASELAERTSLPIEWQDEALTSVKAKQTLEAMQKPYNKSDIDALAASYILADYLQEGLYDSSQQ